MDSSTVMNKDLARFAKSSTNLAIGDYNTNVSPKNTTKRSVIFKGVGDSSHRVPHRIVDDDVDSLATRESYVTDSFKTSD